MLKVAGRHIGEAIGRAAILWITFAVAAGPATAQDFDDYDRKGEVLTVGAVSTPRSGDIIQSFVKRLEDGLAGHGIDRVDLRIAQSNSHLREMVDERRVDIVLSYGQAAAMVMSRNRAAPMLQTVQANYDEKEFLIFVRNDSPVHDLSDLEGRVLTFEDVRQNGNFFSPAWSMLSKGIEFFYLDTIRASPAPKGVSVTFAGVEQNMTAWLYRGLVDAVAFDHGDWNNDNEVPPYARTQFRLVHEDTIKLHGYAILISRKAASRQKYIEQSLAPGKGDDAELDHHFIPITEDHERVLGAIASLMRSAKNDELAK